MTGRWEKASARDVFGLATCYAGAAALIGGAFWLTSNVTGGLLAALAGAAVVVTGLGILCEDCGAAPSTEVAVQTTETAAITSARVTGVKVSNAAGQGATPAAVGSAHAAAIESARAPSVEVISNRKKIKA